MSIKRRTFLKGTLAGGAVAVAVGAGLVTPRAVLAAWPKSAFEAKSAGDAISALYGNAATEDSSNIEIQAPDIAENGAVVPITVTTSIANPESISIIADQNASPLAAAFNLADSAEGFVATRIKMARTSDVHAVVRANGKLYSTKKEVKVTIGGCGG